jgi:opacity protein-like surface antigen
MAGPYVGAGIGNAKFNGAYGSGSLGAGQSVDRTNLSYRVFGGYSFNRYVALEAAYSGGIKATYDFSGASSSEHSTTDLYTIGVGVVGKWPFTEKFGALAKAGFARWSATEDFRETVLGVTQTESDTINGNKLFYGVGLSLAATNQLDLRLEFEKQSLPFDLDVKQISVSASWRF